ncbi:MAG TPA: GntR family transcriptional regulator [Dermatophilaceae bacterium]
MEATAGMPSASDRAYAHVKRGILDGTHAGGQFFTEGEVAEAVGVSRTPVREALLRLEVEGLVRLYPKKGAMIVPVSAQEAQDVVEARAVIEEWAASRMWPHRKEILDDLGGLLAAMRTARKAGAVEDFVAADRTFHERIVSAAGNAILTRQYRSLRERQLCISHVVMRVSYARMDRAVTSHRHLIELLAAGTKADFLAATHDHLKLAHEQAGGVR